jgi:predicted O-methyltransferase YrrM
MRGRIRIVRGCSGEMESHIPLDLDFAFIDGDHSWNGISTDWQIVSSRLKPGGVVCLHDTIVPASEPWKVFDSVRYFQEVIAQDRRFLLVDQLHSLTVLRKVDPPAAGHP